MPRTRLTDIAVRSLKPPSRGQVTYWDESIPSFGCRVSAGGTKTFTVMCGERRKRISVGRYPTISLAQARAKAKTILAEAVLGKHDDIQIPFEEALDTFLTTHCARNNKASTAAETERLLKRHFLPRFRRRNLADITTAHVVSIVDGLIDRPAECNHAFTAVRTFFRWACRRRYLQHSPCEGLQRPTKPVSRSRVLNDKELPKVFQAADQLGTYGSIVKLLILTGQRLNEIASLRAEYVDVKKKVITLPAHLTKNGREHTFPYGPMVTRILSGLPKEGLLFPTQKDSKVFFNNWSASKHALDKLCQIESWVQHDLRRTYATNMAALRVPLHVVEKLLNHASGSISGVSAIYNRYAYEDEMREAVLAWEKHFARLLRRSP